MAKKYGILIVNLGSPDKLSVSAVRRFLRRFLSDTRVVNLPRIIWWPILNFVILPFRPFKSAKAYAEIWREQGSPLTVLTQALVDKLQANLDKSYDVKMAMSYSQPDIKTQLAYFKQQQYEQLVVLPLYPQYSSTTTASVFDAVTQAVQKWRYVPNIDFISDYYQHPLYIDAIAQTIKQAWKQSPKNELLLLSFHGLPEKLTEWGDPYFNQCHKTAELIAQQLKLPSTQWKIVFQSRFGRAKWLQPYCIETLMALPESGVKSVDIICPGFAVDCLETLEEINMTNKGIFLEAGGEEYRYIEALNDSDEQITLMVDLVTKKVGK